MKRGLKKALGAIVALVGATAVWELSKPEGRRAKAVRLVRSVVPARQGDAAWNDVTKDFGGSGTTCGYLPAWLLSALGDPHANRDVPGKTKYSVGKNISAVANHPAFHRWQGGPERPKPGDIYLQSDGPPATEHVGVVLSRTDDSDIVTADYGQRGADGVPSAKILKKYLVGRQFMRRDGVPGRTLVGWIDIERVGT